MALYSVSLQWETVASARRDPDLSLPDLSPSIAKTLLWDCSPPLKDTAEVRIIERQGGQRHTIKVDVAALKALPAGKHEVVISITALDQARVIVDGQSK
jgi:hypothetical protein